MVLVAGLAWLAATASATCSDGVLNGDETGVDCGGSCPSACIAASSTPLPSPSASPSAGAAAGSSTGSGVFGDTTSVGLIIGGSVGAALLFTSIVVKCTEVPTSHSLSLMSGRKKKHEGTKRPKVVHRQTTPSRVNVLPSNANQPTRAFVGVNPTVHDPYAHLNVADR